ncbi:MAG: DNA-processing protein DprA [Firmicutes bacterium]|nr:DNA-processing protein DprA [Dethiobacter sp.]MBS3887938.1 DNA-processing protein DprA [Bacillota bacterium]MBS4054222.1 DNA-processing protein DprA [Thermaerobacter sp.]
MLIAVIGSRACSSKESEIAYQLGEGLAAHGCVVMSGLAKGIDTAALTGAVRAQGKTVAVLPTSRQEQVYPRGNWALAAELRAAGGVLVTPFATPCQDVNSLRRRLIERNFLMALYCDAAIVVSDSTHIAGGTAWMLAFCQQLGRPIYRLNSAREIDCALAPVRRTTWWQPELVELRSHIGQHISS